MARDKKKRAVEDMLDCVRRIRMCTDSVAIGISCGKDGVAAGELCYDWFPKITAYYMYTIPNLSFHEQYLTMLEKRWADKLVFGKILRLPHWALSKLLQHSALRPDGLKSERVPTLNIKDIEVKVTKETGINWFVSGQKKADSLERRAMLNKDDGIIVQSHRCFPLMSWSNRSVTQYLRQKNIPLSPEYGWGLGCSYGGQLQGEFLKVIRDNSPADYERIKARFPYSECELARYEAGLKNSPAPRRQA